MAGRDKHEARLQGRGARAGIGAAERESAGLAVAHRALELPAVSGARTVLAYAATPDELDPTPLVTELRSRGARVAYPRVTGPGALALHWCESDGSLAPGYCGIAEPDAGLPVASPDQFDLVLVPGTAFDEACGRLGMGGGFYDRLLPDLGPNALAIGLAFDEQVVAKVPAEAHDVPLDAVLTPTRTIVPRG
jgi:5-formyltetrahydrofolate cyclo-ligase